jgi:hypothetical protein
MQRVNDALNLRLAHTGWVLVVLLQENHLDTARVRKLVNDDLILPYLRIAFLKGLVALAPFRTTRPKGPARSTSLRGSSILF